MDHLTDHRADAHRTGEHFLKFSIDFFNRSRYYFQQQNCIKAGTQAFHALVTLSELHTPSPTMSQLAEKMGITKQQLTKLVNDLEDKELVRREHDSRNRRHVYLTITSTGARVLGQLRDDMLSCTVSALSVYSHEELADLDRCLTRLTELLPRFCPDPMEEPRPSEAPDASL